MGTLVPSKRGPSKGPLRREVWDPNTSLRVLCLFVRRHFVQRHFVHVFWSDVFLSDDLFVQRLFVQFQINSFLRKQDEISSMIYSQNYNELCYRIVITVLFLFLLAVDIVLSKPHFLVSVLVLFYFLFFLLSLRYGLYIESATIFVYSFWICPPRNGKVHSIYQEPKKSSWWK